MIITIDETASEPLYKQIHDQVIAGIATGQLEPGMSLPSVRSLASDLGINLHTVNKAYSVLRQEGFVKLDRRKGAVVSLDVDKIQAMEELRQNLDVVLACGICKNISRSEVHQLVDMIYDTYTRGNPECSGDEE